MDREIRSTDINDIRFDATSFTSAVDSAIRSRTPSNLGASPIHSFASIVDDAIRSGAASNFGSSPVQGFASAVDNAIRSGTASNFGTSPIHGFASKEEMRTVAERLLQAVPNATTGKVAVLKAASAPLFTLAALKAATDNFSFLNMIGIGSYGVVYRAKLVDGREVAIKRMRGGAWLNKKGRIKSELAILSCLLPHKHLVGVVAYRRHKNERLLAYEYMKNGSLYDHLHVKNNVDKDEGSSVLNLWKIRIKIALDASKGIEYLHNHKTGSYIHRDIKSSNILLDATWTARISDYGSLTEASGSIGYIDPEYCDGLNVLTVKSDVYGFGVVLLELLTGKKAILKYAKDGITPLLSLVDVAVPAILAQDLVKILDPKVVPPNVNEALAVELVAYIAIHCVSLERQNRPTMAHIVANLERAWTICKGRHDSISNGTKYKKTNK